MEMLLGQARRDADKPAPSPLPPTWDATEMIIRKPKTLLWMTCAFAGFIGLIVVADFLLPPAQFGVKKVFPGTFKDGRIFYAVPYSGGEIDSCEVAPGSVADYELGSAVLIIRTRILGRCSLSPMPKNWEPPKFH
jgi:hypothetical protein